MKDLALHTRSQSQLALALKRQPQVLILHGKAGVGLFTIAHQAALALSGKHSILEIVPDEKKSIKIDVIRQLYGHTRTKHAEKLIVIIDEADIMLSSAQNALLKLLEDTPPNTVFLLTSHYPQLLLATIRSRAQEIEILPLTRSQTQAYIDNIKAYDEAMHPQLLFLATGLPAELSRLATDEYRQQRIQEMGQAKQFIAQSLYEKLVTVYKLSNDRSAALTLLRDSMHIVETTLKLRPDGNLVFLLQKLLATEQKILSDGHVRSQLLNLATSTAHA